MKRGDIDRALQEATDTREVVIGAGALKSTPHVYRRSFEDLPILLIADENTFAAAGRETREHLTASGLKVERVHLFPGRPRLAPDIERVTELEQVLRPTGAIPVVIGSGTLNDITKLAAHHCQRSYLVVATAASMDGYTSFASAITHAGIKRVDSCPAPRALVADLEVLARAPAEMASSGYGDLAGKVVSGADWMIADALGVDPIQPQAWSLVQPSLREWIAEPEALRAGDRRALEHLVGGLVMSGLAMQAARSSWPASGSEHLFSHLWEMEGLHQGGEPVPHGFKVGLGAVASSALFELVLARDFASLDVGARRASWPARADYAEWVRAHFPSTEIAESAAEEALAKHLSSEQLAVRLERIQSLWPSLREKLRTQLLPAHEIAGRLSAAGCPTTPEAIGLSRADLKRDYGRARLLRTRYTLLDLAFETGCLEASLEALFAPGGYWGEETALPSR